MKVYLDDEKTHDILWRLKYHSDRFIDYNAPSERVWSNCFTFIKLEQVKWSGIFSRWVESSKMAKLKVKKFQNENVKSSHCPKDEQKFWTILP